ncbi:MAG: hypothetical protein ACYTXE_25560 [Nostoc sp.]
MIATVWTTTAIASIPITEILIMPQVATTVTPCVKVEELRVIEISFYDHEYYAGRQLIATITHDDDLTQPWLVIVNDKEVHRTATLMLCHRYICLQYKRGTLPVQEETNPSRYNGE